MQEPVIRGVGLVAALGTRRASRWLYATQPQTVAQVTGGFASIVGAYTVDPQAFADGLRFFRGDQFAEARAALLRADPAERDPRTQFYIAYAYYREGWGRLYNDDALFGQGPAAVDKAIALAPGGRLVVDDPDLADALGRRAARRAAARHHARGVGLQPAARVRDAQMSADPRSARPAAALPHGRRCWPACGSAPRVALVPPSLFSLVLATMLLAALVRSGALAPDRAAARVAIDPGERERRGGARRRSSPRPRRCSAC